MNARFPTGSTAVFPVVGHPIEQVRSPEAISAIFARRDMDAVVVPMCVAPVDISSLLSSLSSVSNTPGFLVTIPHKRAALALCASVTERARFVAAVNVVRRSEDGWFGDNTDGVGYLDGIERHGFKVAGKRALLIGCGGAGSAIALEILTRHAAHLAIHDVDLDRRDEVIARLAQRFPGRVAAGSRDPRGFDLIANATPMGMKAGDLMPVDISALLPEQFVACAITKPAMSPLIEAARQRGCETMTGIEMFDAQAETLADFLLGVTPDAAPSIAKVKAAVNFVS